MTDHIGVTHVKNETKLSWPIGIGAKCDENQIGQQRDWSYRCGLHKKTKLSCRDLLDQVQFVTKTRLDNDVIDHTGAVYAENKIELSWPIEPGAICDKNQIGQWRDRSYMSGLHWNWN